MILLLFTGLTVEAQTENVYTVKTVPNNQLHDALDFVTNPDGIISQSAEDKINQLIQVIRDSTSAEIAVVLLNSIGTEDIDDFGTSLFMDWGIGKKSNDNGLLFLLVYDQRQMIFRTGYGIEGLLPDIILGRIIRNDISPYLKAGDFDNGVVNGMERVSHYLLDPNAISEIKAADQQKQENIKKFGIGYLGITVIVFVIFVVFLFYVLFSSKTNYKKYLALDTGKSVVVVFAVLFPVLMILYAVFYFRKKKSLRTKPFPCPACGNMMKLLNESEEDTYLTQMQQTEESVHSIDYDVWFCDHCGKTEVYPFIKMFSSYTRCPQCNAKTYTLIQDKLISRSTAYSSGVGEKIYLCKNCNYTMTKRYIIPKVVASSSSGSGRGGSFGGGGSWGGGSTGGGGARGGW